MSHGFAWNMGIAAWDATWEEFGVHVAESFCLQRRIRTGRSQDAVEDKNLVRSEEGVTPVR